MLAFLPCGCDGPRPEELPDSLTDRSPLTSNNHHSVELGEEMLVAAAREVAEETTLDHNHLQFYPRCFMTTDAIYNDAAGAVKYHFVISQVRCVAWARLALRLLLGC